MSSNRTTDIEQKRNPFEELLRKLFQERLQRNESFEDLADLVIDNEEEFLIPISITEADEPGPPTDTMGPTKHQPPLSQMGGYDTIELGLYGEWDEIKSEKLFKELSLRKVTSQNQGTGYTMLEDKVFAVRAKGFSAGKKNYEYALDASGVMIAFCEKVSKSHPAIRIRYGFEALIGRDAFAVHAAILELLRNLGFMVKSEKIGRVDLTVDLLDIPVSHLILPKHRNEVVCRAKGDVDIRYKSNGSPNYLRHGSDIQICVYDKVWELLQKPDVIKQQLMIEHRFGGVFPEHCARVEFRIKREKLKEMGIDSMDDLRETQHDLAEFLHTHWFRILNEKKRKGHTAEQEISGVWKKVQETFNAAFPCVADDPRSINREWNKKRDVECDNVQLKKTAAGTIARFLAEEGKACTIEYAREYAVEFAKEWAEEIALKAVILAEEITIKRGVNKFEKRFGEEQELKLIESEEFEGALEWQVEPESDWDWPWECKDGEAGGF